MTDTITEPPSEKQLELIRKLAWERDYPMEKIELMTLTGGREGTATKLIDRLIAMEGRPSAKKRPRQPAPEPGHYLVDDKVVRVSVAKARGNWYAKAARRKGGKLSWSYLGQRIDLTEAQELIGAALDEALALVVMTKEEA